MRLAPLGLIAVAALALLAACTTEQRAPVSDRAASRSAPARSTAAAPRAQPRPDTYVVKRGDTLYSIALDNGLDYRELAEWNGLTDPAAIQAGQELRLKAPESTVEVQPAAGEGQIETRPLAAEPAAPRPVPIAPGSPAAQPAPGASRVPGAKLVTEPKATKLPYSDENLALMTRNDARAAAVAPAPGTAPAAPAVSKPGLPPAAAAPAPQAQANGEDKVDWSWPASGKVLAGFSEASNKGVDIGGKIGDPVFASAAGRVIYSGQDLRGYGKLVIIKHNPTFLSAYAHNNSILVKVGQSVKKGQKIAEIGKTDSQEAKLHFEIRRFGKPIDPVKLLPERTP